MTFTPPPPPPPPPPPLPMNPGKDLWVATGQKLQGKKGY